jgi:surfactin synthase thioesterase subunit
MFGTEANVFLAMFILRHLSGDSLSCILAFELEYTLHDAGDCDLQSVYISAQYGAVLNMELEAILDEFMLL